MSTRALCLSTDVGLRRSLRRALGAAGASVIFFDGFGPLVAAAEAVRRGETLTGDLGELVAGVHLVLVDEPQATSVSFADAAGVLAWLGNPKVVLLGDALGLDASLDMLRRTDCDHVLGSDEGPDGERAVDEGAVLVTSLKLLRGDIFGVERYLTHGVQVHEREIRTYDEKRTAIGAVADYAKDLGCRRQLIARIESVTDELLMNALYDAPFLRTGINYREHAIPGGGAIGPGSAMLRYACDGHYLGVSVQDGYGELRKASILDHLARAREEKGAPRRIEEPSQTGGAGLGLYFILNSVTRFVANVRTGAATEVIGLFDVRGPTKETNQRARTLSIFVN